MPANFLDELVGFRVQASGIECEDAKAPARPGGHVHKNYIFGAAETDVDVRRVPAPSEFKNFAGILPV
jgi:hypothetical protein